jgi:dUTP pyrophosphatase
VNIYLATSVDFGRSSESDAVRTLLIEDGHTVYAPYRAFGTKIIDGPYIQQINQYALLQSDLLFASLPHDQKSLGVPMEIQFAINNRKPVVFYTDTQGYQSAIVSWLRTQPMVIVGDNLPLLMRQLRNFRHQVVLQDRRQVMRWFGEGQQPKTGKTGDAGFDLYYCDDQPLTIQPGEFQNVRSKIAVQFPDDIWGLIVGRSSTFSRKLFVAPSVIDQGYRGELYACCWNIGSEPQVIEPGDRVAQIVPLPLTAAGLRWANLPLDDSERGATGFGSTGR